jgi:outer membrane protein assembly factor BamB
MKSHVFTKFAQETRISSTNYIAKATFRTPLSEVGQSGICLSGDHLFLTVHKKLDGPLKGGFYFNSDIAGQCFDRNSGELLWQVDLPGSYSGRFLESWHDATSLTPVSNDEYVVFHNLNGMLGCYTHEGTFVWQRSWQAPDPDIKNCRMFLHDDSVIVALPSKKIAVEASRKHSELPVCNDSCSGEFL